MAPDTHTARSLQGTLKKEEGLQDGLATMPSMRMGGRLLPRRLCSPCWPTVPLSWLGHPTEGPRKMCVSVWIGKSLTKRHLLHRHILTLSQLSGKRFLMMTAYPTDDQVVLTPASDTSGKLLLNSREKTTPQTGKPTHSPQTCSSVIKQRVSHREILKTYLTTTS